MSISRILERDIDSAKSEVDSVIQQLLDIIDDQEKEIDNLTDKIDELVNQLEDQESVIDNLKDQIENYER